MNALFALAVATLFASGIYAMLKRDLVRMIVGLSLVSYAVNVFLIAAGQSRGVAPIHPLPSDAPVSDPLVQALVLTAVVIGAGSTAVVIGLVYRAYSTHGSVDQQTVTGDDGREGAGR